MKTMKTMTESKGSLDEGRALQFDAMMQALATLQNKYKGVRGELLAKVRDELMKLKPDGVSTPVRLAPVPTPPSPDKVLPSCRACGRTMKLNEANDLLVCQNGHTRLPV
jgi:hypothetical protein